MSVQVAEQVLVWVSVTSMHADMGISNNSIMDIYGSVVWVSMAISTSVGTNIVSIGVGDSTVSVWVSVLVSVLVSA